MYPKMSILRLIACGFVVKKYWIHWALYVLGKLRLLKFKVFACKKGDWIETYDMFSPYITP